ncbi:hypothetical protein [Massilia sp. YIM B02443]|uniref:hypothetical protein n=1 Tax=Massilia sp. YIM B02443 TaxID=3050127 RepID=UPI0025B6C5CF|nr:hypothetical protein [Massilia sp. YIM B02443]MDN4038668.1 hypothetical protein [Massilia sp. YIM B02443]
MSRNVSILKWLGQEGEPLSPEDIQFTTKPAKSCRGCLFEHQRSAVCDRACQAAQRAELAHCERGFVYVAKPVDTRQFSIIEGAH